MSCNEIAGLLDDYLDGALPAERRREVSEHLLACPACRRQESAGRALRARTAGLPRAVEPERDLWPEVEARLERRSVLSFPSFARGRAVLAAAAGLVLVVASVLTGYLLGRRDGAPVAGSPATYASMTSLDLAAVHDEYATARRQLEAAIASRRGGLPPAAVAVVEKNLQVIDGAVREIEAALEANPESPELRELLLASYRQGIELLLKTAWAADQA